MAAALLAVALTACGTQEQVAQPEPSSPAASPSASPSPSPVPPAGPTAEEVVLDFLDALGNDTERAWSLLTDRSQQGFGDYAAFEELQTEYAEGLAEFRTADRATLDLGNGVAVVTLSGEVTREGMAETDAVALPVRDARVELLAPRLPRVLAIEVPEPGQVVESGAELRATVPAESTPTAAVDGQVQQVRSQPSDGDRVVVTLSPQLPPGPHVLTVAAVRADGLVVADAVAFRVS